MRTKQQAIKSFIPVNEMPLRRLKPSANHKLLFEHPAATFRKLRDEDDWYLSKDPHRPNHYSPEWRADMLRASDAARRADEVEQANAQVEIKVKDAPPKKPKSKRQPQHKKRSSAAKISTKRTLDESEDDNAANLRRSKRARSSGTPPDSISTKASAGVDEFAGREASSVRRSTRARNSIGPTTTNPTRDTASGGSSDGFDVPSLSQSTRAQVSATSTGETLGFSRVKILVKGLEGSGLGRTALNSTSNSAGNSSVPASAEPAALDKSRKASGGPIQLYTAAQLNWINQWFHDDMAGGKTHEKGLLWHLRIKRDFEREYELTTPLADYSLRNKRQEMKSCGQLDGTVRTEDFYKKTENYPRKVQNKKQVTEAPTTRSAADRANASANLQGAQSVQAESSKKRKHEDVTIEDGPEDVVDDEEEVEVFSSKSLKHRRSGSGTPVLNVGASDATDGPSVEDNSYGN